MNKNRFIFDKLKLLVYNNKTYRDKRLSFELKKEIYLDNFKINKRKDEYYNKCNIINQKGSNNIQNNFHSYFNTFTKNKYDNTIYKNYNRYSLKYNSLSEKIYNNENISNNIMKKNLKINNYTNKSKKPVKKKSNLSIIYKKKLNLQNGVNNNKKELLFYFSPSNKENIDNVEPLTPSILNTNLNLKTNRTINNNYQNINNIFLSENLYDYQAEAYNPTNNYNLYSNYLINNNIRTCQKIYKKNTAYKINNMNSLNEINNTKFKEFIINYAQLPFDGLKKNLKKEFSQPNIKKSDHLFIIEQKKAKEISNNKLNNNKYITYNNIININEPKIIHKDINLIKNYENKISRIETHTISFDKSNPQRNKNKNEYLREDIIYYRPKSSSKFHISKK